jgi:hypothetical protein
MQELMPGSLGPKAGKSGNPQQNCRNFPEPRGMECDVQVES